jgi:hypothetical protein
MPKSAAPTRNATPARLRPSANGTATSPARPAATNARMRTRRRDMLDRLRMAMTPLRQVMRWVARRP